LPNNYDNLIRLSFYESSFHFFLKRLNNFNSLSSNKISSLPSSEKSKNLLGTNYLSSLQSIYNISLTNRFTNLLDNTPSNDNTLRNSSSEPKLLSDIILIQKPSYFLTKKK
jgi:hypothetical protein